MRLPQHLRGGDRRDCILGFEGAFEALYRGDDFERAVGVGFESIESFEYVVRELLRPLVGDGRRASHFETLLGLGDIVLVVLVRHEDGEEAAAKAALARSRQVDVTRFVQFGVASVRVATLEERTSAAAVRQVEMNQRVVVAVENALLRVVHVSNPNPQAVKSCTRTPRTARTCRS